MTLGARRTAAGVVASIAVLVLGACGDEESDPAAGDSEASETPTLPSPQCAEIWVDGQDLPDRYRGCYDGSAEVPVERLRCASGQTIVTFADRYYAVPGNVVNDVGSLSESADYKRAERSCGG